MKERDKFISLDAEGYKGIAFEIINRAVSALPFPGEVNANYERKLRNKYWKKKFFLQDGELPERVANYVGYDENNFRSQAVTALQSNTCTRWKVYSGDSIEPQEVEYILDKEKAVDDLVRRLIHNEQFSSMRGKSGKLGVYDVLEIRERYEDGESISEITEDFEVVYSTIRSVVVGETWNYID